MVYSCYSLGLNPKNKQKAMKGDNNNVFVSTSSQWPKTSYVQESTAAVVAFGDEFVAKASHEM